MKKIFSVITFGLIFGSSLFADNIIGVDYVLSKNTFKRTWLKNTTEVVNDSSAVKINYGIGSKLNNLIIQTYLLFEEYDNGINQPTSSKYSEFGVELIKGIDITRDISTFAKIGIGTGSYDYTYTNDANQDGSLSSWNVKVGLGLMYKFSMFDFHVGLDYQSKSLEDIYYSTPINESLQIEESSTKMYIGTNIWF